MRPDGFNRQRNNRPCHAAPARFCRKTLTSPNSISNNATHRDIAFGNIVFRRVSTYSSPVEDVFPFIMEPQRKTGTGDARQRGISREWWREQRFQAALGGAPLLKLRSRP